MGTFIASTLLVGVAALIIKKIIRDKKNGKTCCGGDCGNCRGGCHPSPCSRNNHPASI